MGTFDEGSVVVEKFEVAKQLLDRALEELESGSALVAVVLGGTAEDLFEGMLHQRQIKHSSSRQQLAVAMPKVFAQFFPGESPPSERDAVEVMREAFNWLRHADRMEAQARRLNLKAEALAVCMRAIDNLWELTGQEHPAAARLGFPVGR